MARRNLEGNKFVGLSVVFLPPNVESVYLVLFLFFRAVDVISSTERAGPALVLQPVSEPK